MIIRSHDALHHVTLLQMMYSIRGGVNTKVTPSHPAREATAGRNTKCEKRRTSLRKGTGRGMNQAFTYVSFAVGVMCTAR